MLHYFFLNIYSSYSNSETFCSSNSSTCERKSKNAHVVSKLLNLYKFIKILAISEFDKEIYLCSALKCFQKIKFFKTLTLI